MVLQLNQALGHHVGRVPATLLFEQITLAGFTRRQLFERPDAPTRALGDAAPGPVDGAPRATAPGTGPASPVPPAAVSAEQPPPPPEEGPEQPPEEDLERVVGARSDAQVETTC